MGRALRAGGRARAPEALRHDQRVGGERRRLHVPAPREERDGALLPVARLQHAQVDEAHQVEEAEVGLLVALRLRTRLRLDAQLVLPAGKRILVERCARATAVSSRSDGHGNRAGRARLRP